MIPARATMAQYKTRFESNPREYSGASEGLYKRGPIMFPRDCPMKSAEEVHFPLVSPPVLDEDHEYMRGTKISCQYQINFW